MSILEPCTDNTTQETENSIIASGIISSDWMLPEMNLTGESVPFDGKIIARMPDLGEDCFAANIERSKSASFWTKAFFWIPSAIQRKTAAVAGSSQNARQQFFLRLTSFGCAVLFCGIVILFFERGRQTESTGIDTVETVVEKTETPVVREPVVVVSETTPSVPVLQPEVANAPPDVALGAVPPPAAEPPAHSDSIWNRPPGNSFSPWESSPWESAPRPPEHSFGNTAAGNTTAGNTAAMGHPPVPHTVTMQPMTDMTAQVPPFEHQLVAQSHVPAGMPVHMPMGPPVDPFAPAGHQGIGQGIGHVVHGMAPMQGQPQGQQNNMPGIATSQGVRQQAVSPPVHPQYVSPSAVQGMHPPFSQQHPQTVPPSMPIPSGVSTLPTQSSHYPLQQHPQQHSPGIASPQHSGGGFHPSPPPTHRFF